MIDVNCAKEKLNLKGILDLMKYKINFNRSNPTYFTPDGIVAFVGAQGTGKTLSAVNYVYKLLKEYPKSKIVTNLQLTDYPIVKFEEFVKGFNKRVCKLYEDNELKDEDYVWLWDRYCSFNRVFPFRNNDDFMIYKNLDEGVIFLVDEIQLYLNSLESKNINMEVITQLSQQRKQRLHIVCTSQVFGRMAKPLREQFSNVIVCSNVLQCMQVNKLVDRDSISDNADDMHLSGEVKHTFRYIRTPQMFKRYDTYYTISNTKFVSEEQKVSDIYDRSTTINASDN